MARRSARRQPAAESPRSGVLTSKLRLVGVAIICAKVALVPLVFDTASDIPFTVPKGLVSHALAYALTGVVIGVVLLYGRSVLVQSWLHIPVVLFLAVNIAATVFAADQLLALYGAHGRMVGLATIADGVLLYFAIVLLVRTRLEALAVVASGLGATALVLVYALVQFVGRDPFAWNVSSAARPFSTLGQTTSLAEYLTRYIAPFIGVLVGRRLRSQTDFLRDRAPNQNGNDNHQGQNSTPHGHLRQKWISQYCKLHSYGFRAMFRPAKAEIAAIPMMALPLMKYRSSI